MHRVVFSIPALGWTLHSFSAALAAACFAALMLTAWRAKRERIDPESVYGLSVWLMSGGFLGARLLYLVAHPEQFHGPLDVLKIWQGGIVYYGCILGGLVGSVLYWRRRRFPFLAMADAVAPALAIGSAIGRVGCHFNGCCYGGVSQLPWAIEFPRGALPWARQVQAGLLPWESAHSLPVQPTQLYAVFDGLFLLALLTWFYPRRRRDGEVMALLMLTYPVTRFLIEALRDDEPALALGLTMSQWISVAIFSAGLAFLAHLSRRPRVRHADGPVNSRANAATALRVDPPQAPGRTVPPPRTTRRKRSPLDPRDAKA